MINCRIEIFRGTLRLGEDTVDVCKCFHDCMAIYASMSNNWAIRYGGREDHGALRAGWHTGRGTRRAASGDRAMVNIPYVLQLLRGADEVTD